MKFILKAICLMLPLGLMAQAPQIISYQAVIRDTTGVLVQNQSVALEFLIIQGNVGNAPSYYERQTALTNTNGLISTSVGQGTVVSGSMAQIDWSNGPFYMVVNIDPLGGSNYWLSTLTEILTVPYALYANRADSADHFLELDPLFQNSIAANITALDTARWNAKADSLSEIDPIFISSLAYTITSADTAYWNSKPDSLVEIDPLFTQSIAAGISSADTAYWNNKLSSFTESDPIFSSSQAANINANDITNLSNLSGVNSGDQDLSLLASKQALSDSISALRNQIPNVSGYITVESDPQFTTSVASGITNLDTAKWNSKQDSLIAGNGISIIGNTISASPGSGLTHFVGELFGGGIVVAVWKENGIEHGLIASLTDLGISTWSNSSSSLIGASAQSRIDGQSNTAAMMTQSPSGAALLCDNYSAGGFNDWYLPAIWELNQCYNAAFIVNTILGSTNGFQLNSYWSSTESYFTHAFRQNFFNGLSDDSLPKHLNSYVRAVRRF